MAPVAQELVAGERGFYVTVAIRPGVELLDDPRGESGGRVRQPERKSSWLRALDPLISALLPEEMLELPEERLLLGRPVFQHLRVAAHGQEIEMDADEALGKLVGEPRGDGGAPVSALRREAAIAQHIGHQAGE